MVDPEANVRAGEVLDRGVDRRRRATVMAPVEDVLPNFRLLANAMALRNDCVSTSVPVTWLVPPNCIGRFVVVGVMVRSEL